MKELFESHSQECLAALPKVVRVGVEFVYKKHPKLQGIDFRTIEGPWVAAYLAPTENEAAYVAINRQFMEIVSTTGLYGEIALPLRERICLNLGIAPSELTVELMALFIVFHELGHAYHLFGYTRDEVSEVRGEMDAEFVKEWRAHNMADFMQKYPSATREQQLAFARAYRGRPTEERADSIASELFQALTRAYPGLFPQIKNKTKNYQ